MPRDKRLWWAGGLLAALVAMIALAAPANTVAESKPMETAAANHFKCYQVLDWTTFDRKKIELADQFGKSVAYTVEPRLLCNPVDKNGEGIPHKESHLVCYEIKDDPVGSTERIKEVEVRNQFQQASLWVGDANLVCVPSEKSYSPRG